MASKYRAQKTECAQGHSHPSKLEAGRCDDLHALQAIGSISDLAIQPVYPVVVEGSRICRYVADFEYTSATLRIVEDVKGVLTPIYRLKKKLVEALNPGVVITEYPPRKRKKRRKVAK